MEYLYDIYGILVEIYIIFLASGVPTIYIRMVFQHKKQKCIYNWNFTHHSIVGHI